MVSFIIDSISCVGLWHELGLKYQQQIKRNQDAEKFCCSVIIKNFPWIWTINNKIAIFACWHA